jgi:hypothetical protein
MAMNTIYFFYCSLMNFRRNAVVQGRLTYVLMSFREPLYKVNGIPQKPAPALFRSHNKPC